MNKAVFIVFLLPLISWCQQDYNAKLDSLRFVTEMPYICNVSIINGEEYKFGCGDKLFWDVVKGKEEVIPFLIDKLEDSTLTTAIVPNFGYHYTVGDISYAALKELIHNIPTFDLLGVKFDEEGCGYCSYWQHLNENYSNRINFKKAVKNWYYLNKNKLIWIQSDRFSTCDCGRLHHPNNGHYEWKY